MLTLKSQNCSGRGVLLFGASGFGPWCGQSGYTGLRKPLSKLRSNYAPSSTRKPGPCTALRSASVSTPCGAPGCLKPGVKNRVLGSIERVALARADGSAAAVLPLGSEWRRRSSCPQNARAVSCSTRLGQ
eukprot:scaffold102965_cov50-Phaeocystis_antarctica.AAC.1